MAGAATTGALVAIGHRLGGIGLPFAAVGEMLIHTAPFRAAPRTVVAGFVLHAVSVVVWSVICVLVAKRSGQRMLAAVFAATGQFIVSWIVARVSGNGLASALALGDRIVYALVLASALVVGMRFAFFSSRSAPRGPGML
jgi:hypothetical protein